MDWWILELITTAVLVAIACWLGPLIKRFGRSYAADVFRANPRTGKSFILLTDVAYYLIFFSYILFTVRFDPPDTWDDTVNAAQLQHETARVAGILLIIGLLHGVNLLALPVMGRLLDAQPPARRVDTAWTGGTDKRAPRRGHGDRCPPRRRTRPPARTTGSRSSCAPVLPDELIEQTSSGSQDGDVLGSSW